MMTVRSACLAMFLVPLLSLGVPRAQDPADSPARPEPPGVGRQILGGTLYGAGGVAGAGLLTAGCALWGEDCGFAGIGGAFAGGVLGFAAAFPLGAYRFGTNDQYSGSIGWTYSAALLGSAVGFGGWALATGLDDEDAWFQSTLMGLAGAPIGALIGFNLTRAPRAGMPQVSVGPMPGGGWAGRLAWSLR